MDNTNNAAAKANIKAGFGLRKCYFCDLLENLEEQIGVQDNSISISLGPKKIKTLLMY